MDAFRAWLGQLQFDGVWQTVVLVAASLLCITFHETCHGWVAYKLGDPTAKRMGRLTLNPLKHVDLAGLIMMALFRFGWAKPVPVDMRNFKNPKQGMALTALAGPVSNVVLAYVAVVILNFLFFWLDNFGGGWLLMGRRSWTTASTISPIPTPSARGLPSLTSFRSRRSTGRRCFLRSFPTGRMTSSCATNDTVWDF